jgi:methionine synthase II (cobalamin-independent)
MKNKPTISRNILIEELINNYSFSVRYLMEKGIRCIRCGEPIWGTLEEAAKEKDFDENAIQVFVKEMNDIAEKGASEK